jgi:hypothetical protein
MKNLFLLFLAVTFALTSSAQLKGWNVSTGATVFMPIAKNVNWDSKFWGQRVSFTKKSVNITLGYMQNRTGDAQIPVLAGVERNLGKIFRVGLRSGVTFFNDQKGQFTYMPSIRYNLNKKWCVEQSVLRMVKDGKHSSQVGFGAFYHF